LTGELLLLDEGADENVVDEWFSLDENVVAV
jgi:hypothetical protein